MRAPARIQGPKIEIVMAALDGLLAQDHQARVVWAFVERQDLSEFYGRFRATKDRPGRTPIGPHLLMAPWMSATLDGIGSARELARRCEDNVGIRLPPASSCRPCPP
jgi:hypothetical protein